MKDNLSPIGSLSVNGTECPFEEGDTVLAAALRAGIYIPNLCHHPDLPPPDATRRDAVVYRGVSPLQGGSRPAAPGGRAEGRPAPEEAEVGSATWSGDWSGCGLCVVEISGVDEPVRACVTQARDGMEVFTDSERVAELRRRNLAALLATHPHACLSCAEREGCTRVTCSLNVPVEERCCELLGKCELQKVAEYVGIPPDTPKFKHPGLPVLDDEPLFRVDYNLCIACGRCVRACNDLRQVGALGSVEIDGRAVVGHLGQGGLRESECRFCGACVEVCPTGALTDKAKGSGAREERLVPCRAACPAGVDVPRYIRLIAQGRYREATEVVRERAPLPVSLGNACFHPCETTCRRGELDEPVAICDLKRFAAEREEARTEPAPVPPTGKKVAVVGSGPAGLTCAWYLAKKGHSVEVFEAGEEPGGMMTQAIPEFRLPKEKALEEIEALARTGVTIKVGSPVPPEAIEKMLDGGFDAVFVAVGNAEPKRIDLAGAEGPGVFWGLDLLRRVKRGERPQVGDRVVVVGGGNVAVDAALTTVHLGAREVSMVCLESEEEMPAYAPELEAAVSEGVGIHNSWGPSRILRRDGRVTAIEFVRCTRVFDESGAFNPSFDENERRSFEADGVILAIGQKLAPEFAASSLADARGRIAADPETCETRTRGVFAGGEGSRGPLSIIGAVEEGRKAARSIDLFLGGDGLLEPDSSGDTDPAIGRMDGFARLERQRPASAPGEAHARAPRGGATPDNGSTGGAPAGGFSQMVGSLTEEQARLEARRCLQCDLRLEISPVTLPPRREVSRPLDRENAESAPAAPGVYTLFDAQGEVIKIAGTADLRAALLSELETGRESVRFQWEEEPMYTQRESELIQQYLQEHGRMPGGAEDDLDDLF